MTLENDGVLDDEDEGEALWDTPHNPGVLARFPANTRRISSGFARFVQLSRSARGSRSPSYPTVEELAGRPMLSYGGAASSDDNNLAAIEDRAILKPGIRGSRIADDIRTSGRFIVPLTKPGFIYLAGHEKDALFKIGFTADLFARSGNLHRPLIHKIRTHNMFLTEKRVKWIYSWRSASAYLGPRYRRYRELFALSAQEVEEFKWFQDYDADRANFVWRIVERRRELGYNL
jgi:hypothetical protein